MFTLLEQQGSSTEKHSCLDLYYVTSRHLLIFSPSCWRALSSKAFGVCVLLPCWSEGRVLNKVSGSLLSSKARDRGPLSSSRTYSEGEQSQQQDGQSGVRMQRQGAAVGATNYRQRTLLTDPETFSVLGCAAAYRPSRSTALFVCMHRIIKLLLWAK